jgi:hypothetical protein
MYAVVRRYPGGSALADALVQRRQEVTDLLKGVPGFKMYHALRAADGTIATITLCDDQAGTQETSRRAAGWVRENLPNASFGPPEITEGEVFLDF